MSDQSQPSRLLTFRSGGWVLALSGVLCLGVIIWALSGIFTASPTRLLGNREDPRTYGFDLSSPLIPIEQIVAVEKRGQIHALDHPAMITPLEADRYNQEERDKYLVSDDRVIGIVINGEARAYPLRMLDWHEIVNDTVGGLPIAITYNGLCDSAAVFLRQRGEQTLSFGVSGLLYNSNLLMYDQHDTEGGESLWSQLQARAITGAHAAEGATLTVLPSALTTWSDWRQRYPDTVVLAPNPDPALDRFYKRRAYGSYFSNDELKFPVSPLAPAGERSLKDRIVAVRAGDRYEVFAIDDLAALAGEDGIWDQTVRGVMLRFEVDAPNDTVVVTDDGALTESIYTFWFAWFALRHVADLDAP